jgi:hypothetical protein
MNADDIKAADYINTPRWIDQDLPLADLEAINQGGCASGAYTSAVPYRIARETMNEHGCDVLDYITETLGELPDVSGESWSGMACKYRSCAVEARASSAQDELEAAVEEMEEA